MTSFHRKYLAAVYRMGGLRWGKELCDLLEAITNQQLCPLSTDGEIVWDDYSWKQARKNKVLRDFLDQYRDYSKEEYSKEQRKLMRLHWQTIREHSPGTPIPGLENLSKKELEQLELRTCQGKISKTQVAGPDGKLGSMTQTFAGCGMPYKEGPDVYLCGNCSTLPPEEEKFEQYPDSDDEYSNGYWDDTSSQNSDDE
jgi:hypothetical protein